MSQRPSELFLKACGLSDSHPFVVEVEGPGQGEAVSRTFTRPFAVAGRNPGTDLVLNHDDVSARHAYLQMIAGRVYCVDMGSRTGVSWEGGPKRSGWVDRDRGVRIGPFRIRAGVSTGATPAEDPLDPRSSGGPDWPALSLEFPQKTGGSPWRVSRVLSLVGRSPSCQLRLTHAEVSKFHCGLLRTQEGVWVIDCLGRGGTRVNGETVRWALLEDGDEIRVGQFVLRVRYGSSAGAAGAGAASSGALARIPSRPPPPSTTAVLPASSPSDSMKAELVEPYLAHLTSQFGQMQQQMFDQFQQAMMQMAQVFGTLHRDQTALVRDELARLRQLNQDLTVLQAELTARSAGAAVPPAIAAADADAAPAATAAALSRIEALLHAALPGPGAADPDPIAGAGPGSRPEQAASPSVPDDGSQGAIADGSTPTGRLSPAMHPAGANDDWIHEHLSRRIAALQEERQGRWQKILGLMSDR